MSPSRPQSRRPVTGGVPAVVLAVLALIVLGLVALGVPALLRPGRGGDEGAAPAAGPARVVRVVDGDTLVVDVGGTEERVRLIGVDTPESVAPHRPVECWGHEASSQLADLVPADTMVRLVRDVEPRDAYDRLLAYVYRAGDDLFVNRALVDAGAAEAMPYPPNTTHRSEFAAAERAARTARSGLWGACGGPDVTVGRPTR